MKKRGRPPLEDRASVTLRVRWARSRCQARMRDVEWDLTFEEYYRIWMEYDPEAWHQSGANSDSLVLGRIDLEKGWTTDNVEIITSQKQKRKAALHMWGKSDG